MEMRHYRDADMTEETYTEDMTDSHRRHRDAMHPMHTCPLADNRILC